MDYDFAIKHLENLKGVLEKSLSNWENSDWCNNEIAQEMIRTYKRLIQETDEEITMYIQARKTGVFISREGRNIIKGIQQNKEGAENER